SRRDAQQQGGHRPARSSRPFASQRRAPATRWPDAGVPRMTFCRGPRLDSARPMRHHPAQESLVRFMSARKPLVIALALALPFGLVACKQPAANAASTGAAATAATSDQEDESARLNAWFDRKYEEQLRFTPTQLTFLG